MDNMMDLLSFMMIPLIITALLSSTLPAMGTLLAIRNELLITLSLPSAAGLAIALLALTGLGESSLLLRIIPAVIILLLGYSYFLHRVVDPVLRQKVLAGIFIGSQAITQLIVAANPEIERYYTQLLNGEMLSVTKGNAVLTAVITLVTIVLLISRFPLIRAYSLDEKSLSRFKSLFFWTALTFRLVVIIQVTLGVITIGPLLTTSLKIIPALFADTGKNGFFSAIIMSTIIAALSLLIGFPGALHFDLPPSYLISATVIFVGGVMKLFSLLLLKKR